MVASVPLRPVIFAAYGTRTAHSTIANPVNASANHSASSASDHMARMYSPRATSKHVEIPREQHTHHAEHRAESPSPPSDGASVDPCTPTYTPAASTASMTSAITTMMHTVVACARRAAHRP